MYGRFFFAWLTWTWMKQSCASISSDQFVVPPRANGWFCWWPKSNKAPKKHHKDVLHMPLYTAISSEPNDKLYQLVKVSAINSLNFRIQNRKLLDSCWRACWACCSPHWFGIWNCHLSNASPRTMQMPDMEVWCCSSKSMVKCWKVGGLQVSTDQNPCYFLYIGDIRGWKTTQFFWGFIIGRYKDPYEPKNLIIMECHKGFEPCACSLRLIFRMFQPTLQRRRILQMPPSHCSLLGRWNLSLQVFSRWVVAWWSSSVAWWAK